jgi:histidine triad (HIT) family protein
LTDSNCIFCKIVSGAIKADIVYEDNEVIAFNDIKPQAPVHILIIPKRHISRLSDLESADADVFGKLAIAANVIARKKMVVETGFRLVANCNKDAGQEVFHIHMHLLGGRKFSWPPG